MNHSLGMFACLVFAADACAAVVFVNGNLATGANNGSSWSDAFRGRLGLKAALAAAAPGDDIWIAEGVYTPAGVNGDPSASFPLRTGVRVLGGFAGGETQANQRNPATHIVELTADLNGNDQSGTFDATWENAWHVVRAAGSGGSGMIDGCTITRGIPAGNTVPGFQGGGGALITGSSPVFTRCRFIGNTGFDGGAVLATGGAPIFEDCLFSENTSEFGSGVCVRNAASVTLKGCGFIDPNHAYGGTTGVGVCVRFDAGDASAEPFALIEDCRFSIQMMSGLAANGTGMALTAGSATIRRTVFDRCLSAGGGGGLAVYDARATVDATLFAGCEGISDGGSAIVATAFPPALPGDERLLLTNCVFTGNGRLGGGATVVAAGTPMRAINCTFFDNGVVTKFHQQVHTTSSARLENCALWGNKSADGNPNLAAVLGGTITVAHSLVEGWSGQFPSTGTFSANPQFVNAPGADGITGTVDDDLRLAAASPCIDRGNNTLVPTGLSLDLAGLPRFRDITEVPDLGIGGPPVVDLGAHERVPTCPTDLTGDGTTNTADLVLFLGSFGLSVAPFTSTDLNGDGSVNTADLVLFLGGFGAGCP